MSTESQSPQAGPAEAEADADASAQAEAASASAPASTEPAPKFTRATLALTAAATLAVVPVATIAFGPAGSGDSAHTSPVYVLAQAAHDIGHNDWAFQGGLGGRIEWASTYVVIGLFWLVAALWIRWRAKRAGAAALADGGRRLWIKALVAAWAAEAVAGSMTLGAGTYVAWHSTALGPAMLRAADVCSPWWSFVAVLLVVGFAEHRQLAVRAAAGYGALLAVLLLVPLPGPDAVKVLVLAAAAAVPALLEPDAGAAAPPVTQPPVTPPPVTQPPVTPDAVAAC